MRSIFISYQHEDVDFAENLKYRLEKAGFTTWLDEEGLHAGDDWRAGIDQAIKDSLALVVVMTPAAKASEYVTYEWAFAWGAGVKVIPILFKNTPLHPRLESLQYLDFRNRGRPWSTLLEVVEEVSKEVASIPAQRQPSVFRSSLGSSSIPVPEDAPNYLKFAVAALDSVFEGERQSAVKTLGQANHPNAYEALLAALQHPLHDVALGAAFELAKRKDQRAIGALIQALDSDDYIVRMSAKQAIEKYKDSDAVPALIEVLRNGPAGVRDFAISMLGEIGDANAVPALIDTLSDRTTKIQQIHNALRHIGRSAVPKLLDMLSNEAYQKNEKDIIPLLGQIGDATAVPALLNALKNEDEEIQLLALDALGQIGDFAVVPVLVNLTQNTRGRMQLLVVEVLGRIGHFSAIPSLLNILRTESANLRGRAAEALGRIGDSIAVSSLIQHLSDAEQVRYDYGTVSVSSIVAQALERIGTPEAIAAVEQWRTEPHDDK